MEKDYKKYNDTAELLKVLAHPVRLCIVKGLINKGQCNVTYMQNCLDMPQSTVSQHLQKLRAAGIIEGDRNGLEINYKVCDERVENLVKLLLSEEEI
ncbi:metalloregulator ArsR/SmtB family transcription factor [Clostridium swellfunianum]|uniref:ArsR/SmtB family transcription factor n=1 Tax=Clostridium swellfunianum TaxID=1367462 RepID=UPI002030DD65|nr:metalloregulator ArsR/SmtB family transcription factor [Clostridium swellfunianum]MCM0646818.1 metalloregulator ArsR/SmtB family transcription factor [Clostridium swellfunianum]